MALNEISWPMNPHLSLSRLFSGNKRSLSHTICILTSLILVIHFLPQFTNNPNSSTKILSKLEQIEQEPNFHLPVRKQQEPKPNKKKYDPLVTEFLDESSEIHSLLFTKKEEENNVEYFYPGNIWRDLDGKPIQSHGGGILFDDKTDMYYWYGENKDGPTYHVQPKGLARVDIIGISCYSSKTLIAWKNEGLVLRAETTNLTNDLHKSNVLERPKVIYNSRTNKYIMWMHIDNAHYSKARVGIAISESPIGPFEYLYSMRPHGCDSRDMSLFKDDDGVAYVVYSSNGNSDFHVGTLTDDYLRLTGDFRKILVGKRREAPAVFKHEKTYYMITSGCSGWAPNEAMVHVAPSMLGPWETMRENPFNGGNEALRNTTFFAQGTFVLPLNGYQNLFVFMADRWNPSNLQDSRYLWLPLKIGGIEDKVSIFWHQRWKLPKHRFNKRV